MNLQGVHRIERQVQVTSSTMQVQQGLLYDQCKNNLQ